MRIANRRTRVIMLSVAALVTIVGGFFAFAAALIGNGRIFGD